MTAAVEPWIDWVVVDRAVVGYPAGRDLTRWERAEAVKRMLRAGHPNRVIRDRLGVSDTTVAYYRQRANRGDKP